MGNCVRPNKGKVGCTQNIVPHMIKMSQYKSISDYINELKQESVPKLFLENNPTYLARLRKSALRGTQSRIIN